MGNGTADDTGALRAAIAAGAGKSVLVPDGTFRITSAVTVPAGTTVTGTGTIHQTATGQSGLVFTGSGVTVQGITLLGSRTSNVYAGGEYAIKGTGGSASSLAANITIRNVTMSGWGAYGVYLQYVKGFTVSGSNVHDIGYTGIGVLSASEGLIENSRVDNITPGSSGNAYGIAMSYSGGDPESSNIVVRGNTVSRVFWEGIDAHGGSGLTIDSNTILNAGDGIALTDGDTSAHLGSNIAVTNNLVEDAAKRGVLVAGQASVYRAGITISGNTFRRTGYGVLSFYTRDLAISNNVFQESSAIGVYLDYNNTNFRISGNTFIDMWSNSAWTAGIHTAASGGTNTGLITSNTMRRGTKTSANYLNQYGYYYRGGLSGITVTTNDFTAATNAPIAGEG